MNNDVVEIARKLAAYCQAEDWAGYEPYDALNSRIFSRVPVLDSRLPRLALTQFLKRSPVNFRSLLLIDKTQNPKALGLFITALLKLSGKIALPHADDSIALLLDRLMALRTEGVPYWCWGYNFPWQTRTVLVPRWEPNLVCTTFAANAMLDIFEQTEDEQYLSIALSAAEYLLDQLYFVDGSRAGFAYPLPGVRNQVHNANFLAAALLARVYRHTGMEKFFVPALRAARYSAAQQHADGAWDYGEAPFQRWNDNFHTGFNLCALDDLGRSLETAEFEPYIRSGFAYYLAHFFREDGAVRYYDNRTYPLDSHCVAQSILTLLALERFDDAAVPRALQVFDWARRHLWDRRGFFYYRRLRACTIRTSYMRWTQAWMLLAVTALLCHGDLAAPPVSGRPASLEEMS